MEADARLHDRRDHPPVVLPELGRAAPAELDRRAAARHRAARRRRASRSRWAGPSGSRGANWLGIALGMLGVAALVGLDIAGSDLIAVAEMAVVVVGYALGPAILARWMSDLPGVGVVAVSLAATAVVYVPFVLLTGGWPTAWPSHGGHRVDRRARRGLQRARVPAHGRRWSPRSVPSRRRRSPTSIPRSPSSRASSCSASGSPCGRSSGSPSCSPARTS